MDNSLEDNSQVSSKLKSRTPSGTSHQFLFKDSRNIFSPERIEEGELRVRSGSVSELNFPSQTQSSIKLALTHTARRNSVSSIVQAVKNRASAKAEVRELSKHKQVLTPSNLIDQSDSENEVFHTPPATPSRIVIKKKNLKKSKGPVQSKWQVGVSHFFRNMKESEKNNIQAMETDDYIKKTDAHQPQSASEDNVQDQLSTTIPAPTSDMNTKDIVSEERKLVALAATAQEHIPDSEKPVVLDIRTVMKMFQKLQVDRQSDIKKEVEQFLSEQLESDAVKLSKIEEELKWSRRRERTMARAVQRVQDIALELATRVDNLEINNAKRCVTITGLMFDGKKDAVIMKIENFLYTDIGVAARVEDTYVINNSDPPTRVVVLMNQQDKFKILKNKSVLKDFDVHPPIYINEYNPPLVSERKKWEKELRKINDQQPDEQKKEVQLGANAMYVDGAQYDPKVIPPGPEDILDLSEKELDDILRIKIPNGPKVSQLNSEFKAYIICAESHQHIQDAYCKVRWIHAAARHIVCAYNLLGGAFYEKAGFCDDGEIGAGRRIFTAFTEEWN